MKENPYKKPIEHIKQVMHGLVVRMCDPELVDMQVFRNMAAIYVVWQADLHLADTAAMNWEIEEQKLFLVKRRAVISALKNVIYAMDADMEFKDALAGILAQGVEG